jgi:lysophospholipase L1-like esterase
MRNTAPVRLLALVLAALALAACGAKVKIDKLAPGAVVLAFGDSLTFGTGAGKSDSYPAILERSTGLKVVNAGVPGEVSADGLARLPDVLEEVQPKLLILCHGGNDFLQRQDEGMTASNVRQMIQLARAKGIPVVLIATPKPGLPPSVPKFYGEIAAELKVPFEDSVLRSVLIDNSLKSDMVHPNGQGYAQVAAAVEKVLKKSGAL